MPFGRPLNRPGLSRVFRKRLPAGKILHGGLAVFAIFILIGCSAGPKSKARQVPRGSALYAVNCQSCHGVAATGEGAILGAPIHGPQGHTWHHPDAQLSGLILGELDYAGKTMPSFADTLSGEDAASILAYLKTNWLPEQRAFQSEISGN